MKKTVFIFATLVALAGLASASTSYTVSGAYASGGSGTTLTTTDGTDTWTLVWSITAGAASNTVSSYPSNVNYGEFTLSCTVGCGPSDTDVVTIPGFTFVITVDDTTDGGTGTFTGTSTGGPVSYNGTTGSSDISVAWAPSQLGPGTAGLTAGTTFGNSFFTIGTPSLIVDPHTNGGITSIQGQLSSTTIPEPATLGLLGAGLLGLGFIARKRKA